MTGPAMTDPDLAPALAALSALHPELAGAPVQVLSHSWDCIALDLGGRFIAKLPRHARAAASLRREVALLHLIGPRLPLPVPAPVLHEGPPLFTLHRRIPGDHLPPALWSTLDIPTRDRVAAALAGFLAALHAIPAEEARAAGALPVEPWTAPDQLAPLTLPHLPPEARARAETVLDAIASLPPDPAGEILGHFDGHGWNMAFDPAHGVLNGIYDFGDSGIGPLHREFTYGSFVAPDLASRLITAYELRTGRRIDRRRVALLTAHLRLHELAAATDPAHRQAMRANLLDWIRAWPESRTSP